MVLFHTVTIGLWFFQYVRYSEGTYEMETFPKLMRIILINRGKSAKKMTKKHWHDIHVLNILIKCIVKLIYWKMINSGCLLVLTLTDPFYVLSCFKICDPAVTSLILLPFFLPLVYFLAGSTTCTNPEEPDHVRLLPWAWRVRHQWPFPAGIDTSPVYVATFKSAISDVGCSGTNLTCPLVRKTQPYKDSLEEIAHSHDKHFACEAENGFEWLISTCTQLPASLICTDLWTCRMIDR